MDALESELCHNLAALNPHLPPLSAQDLRWDCCHDRAIPGAQVFLLLLGRRQRPCRRGEPKLLLPGGGGLRVLLSATDVAYDRLRCDLLEAARSRAGAVLRD